MSRRAGSKRSPQVSSRVVAIGEQTSTEALVDPGTVPMAAIRLLEPLTKPDRLGQ